MSARKTEKAEKRKHLVQFEKYFPLTCSLTSYTVIHTINIYNTYIMLANKQFKRKYKVWSDSDNVGGSFCVWIIGYDDSDENIKASTKKIKKKINA